MIYLVRFQVIEPCWIIVRSKDTEECKNYVDKWLKVNNLNWTYLIRECKKGNGIILEEEY